MNDVVDAALEGSSVSDDSDTEEDGLDPAPSAQDYDPARDPHVKLETRDQRERDGIKRAEFEALSNDHKYGRGDGHGRDPFDRMLPHRIEGVFHKMRSRKRQNDRAYKQNAPYRVQIKHPKTGKTESVHFYHGKDVAEFVADLIIPVAKGTLKARVQKRYNGNEWWSGRNYPHKCTHIDPSEVLFGLNKMARADQWPIKKTRLPEMEMCRAGL